MRELTFDEIEKVSGAGDSFSDDALKFGAAIGSALGAYSNVSTAGAISSDALLYGSLGGMAGAGVAAAGVAGYKLGVFINENTGLQSWISNFISQKIHQPGGVDELNDIIDMYFG